MNESFGSILRVFVADPHPLFTRGVEAMVVDSPKLAWAGSTKNICTLLPALRQESPDVALLDARMSEKAGFGNLRALGKEGVGTVFIVMAARVDQETVYRAVTDGIHGFLLKTIALEDLAEAIRRVAQGQQMIDPTATEALLRKIRAEAQQEPTTRLALLSPQENRVLAEVATGKTNREIGAQLNLSEKTVKNYLSHVLEKLGMRRRAEAAAFYASQVPRI